MITTNCHIQWYQWYILLIFFFFCAKSVLLGRFMPKKLFPTLPFSQLQIVSEFQHISTAYSEGPSALRKQKKENSSDSCLQVTDLKMEKRNVEFDGAFLRIHTPPLRAGNRLVLCCAFHHRCFTFS